MKYINTIEEIEKYIGKPLYFYYNNREGETVFAWAMSLESVDQTSNNIKHSYLRGKNIVVFEDKQTNLHVPRFLTAASTSSAQEYARELTVGEQIIYRLLTKGK